MIDREMAEKRRWAKCDECKVLRTKNATKDAKITELQERLAKAKSKIDELQSEIASYLGGERKEYAKSSELRAEAKAKDAELQHVRDIFRHLAEANYGHLGSVNEMYQADVDTIVTRLKELYYEAYR